jgi:chorismate dehydratase
MSTRIAAVSYLNTKPFIYGMLRNGMGDHLDLRLCIPSECARLLKAGEVDLALTPVAIIPELDQYQIVSDYCIGAHGKVGTVAIYSEVPLDQVQAIWMDFHSRTSVELAKIICREHLHIQPEYWPAQPGFEQHIGGSVAGLVIGDRTIGLDNQFPFVYDLAELWLEMTGLPFVFAAWVANKPLDPAFVQALNHALKDGVQRIPELVSILPTIPDFDLKDYYEHYISYDFDEPKKEALAKFLSYLH